MSAYPVLIMTEGMDEPAFIQTALKITIQNTTLHENMRKMMGAAEHNHLTLWEQAEKWLSHPNHPYRTKAAQIVRTIKVEDGFCSAESLVHVGDFFIREDGYAEDLARYMQKVLSREEIVILHELVDSVEDRKELGAIAEKWLENPVSPTHKMIAKSYAGWLPAIPSKSDPALDDASLRWKKLQGLNRLSTISSLAQLALLASHDVKPRKRK